MEDFNLLLIEKYKNNINKNIETLVIDIDGVIASLVEDGNYSNANAINENINYINKLKLSGVKIILFTARGSASGINWRKVTELQMKEWGVLYDELLFGKPAGDLYIDDKAATPSVLKLLAKRFKK